MDDLYHKIIAVYPELTATETFNEFWKGRIRLEQGEDGVQYIAKWEYDKPLPEGMKVGK